MLAAAVIVMCGLAVVVVVQVTTATTAKMIVTVKMTGNHPGRDGKRSCGDQGGC